MKVPTFNNKFASVRYNMHSIGLCAVDLKWFPVTNFTLSY